MLVSKSEEFPPRDDNVYVLRLGEARKSKTSISLPQPLMATVKALAKEKKVSVSEIVRRALELSEFLHLVLNEGGAVLVQKGPDSPYMRVEIDES